MKIRVEFNYDIEEMLGCREEDLNIHVSKSEFEKAIKKAFRNFVEDSIFSDFDQGGMQEVIREELIGIIEY